MQLNFDISRMDPPPPIPPPPPLGVPPPPIPPLARLLAPLEDNDSGKGGNNKNTGGRFSGRLPAKDDEEKLQQECRRLGPRIAMLLPELAEDLNTLPRLVRAIARGDVRRAWEAMEAERTALRTQLSAMLGRPVEPTAPAIAAAAAASAAAAAANGPPGPPPGLPQLPPGTNLIMPPGGGGNNGMPPLPQLLPQAPPLGSMQGFPNHQLPPPQLPSLFHNLPGMPSMPSMPSLPLLGPLAAPLPPAPRPGQAPPQPGKGTPPLPPPPLPQPPAPPLMHGGHPDPHGPPPPAPHHDVGSPKEHKDVDDHDDEPKDDEDGYPEEN